MTHKTIMTALCAVSLLTLCGCRKESMQIFPDRDCLYTGKLTVHRQPRVDWQLATFQMTDDKDSIAEGDLKPTLWRVDEMSKVVPIGVHKAIYLPQRLSKTMTEKGQVELQSEKESGFRVISSTPILMGSAEGEVKYDEETVVEVLPKDISTGVRVILTNSSSEQVRNIDLTVSQGLVGYDCLRNTATTPSVFKYPGQPFDIASAGMHSQTGYLFGVTLPMTLHLSFRDGAGAEYLVEFEDAFKQDAKNKRLYVAELDLSEAGLEKAGVKRTVKAIRIDGRDVTFPSEGGEMTMDVKAYRVTIKYSGGKELSRDEEEIPFKYEVTGDDDILISYEAPHTFKITADANDTETARSRQIKVTADGVSRTFTITQPYRSGFTVKGEVQ